MSQQNAPYKTAILAQKVICKEPGRYIGWPTICKTQDGELLIVFSGDRDQHVCPWGKTQLVRSTDNGETWSEPAIINDTPLDDRDAGIIQTKSGTLVVAWFTSLAFLRMGEAKTDWLRHVEKLGPETRERWLGNWTRRSAEGGKTWEDPVHTACSAPHGPIELKDGRLLYVGTTQRDGKKAIGVEFSPDEGRSWQLTTTIPLAEQDVSQLNEPHVVEMPDGKLVALVRYEPKNRECFLQQSESADGGKTWSTLHSTPMWGYPPHMIVLRSGWLLAVYGRRKKPFGEMACISRDGAKTWDAGAEIIVSKGMNGDLGYPASTQLDDGSIWTIYYQIDQAGEKTCLMGTHWRLEGAGL